MSTGGDLFPGFAEVTIDTGTAQIFVRYGGAGPGLLLLHSYPQTHVAWHRVSPELAKYFTVVVPDVRGCGRSSCPPTDPSHEAYSRDAMSRDMLAIMNELGHGSFSVIGHGRGGCIALRLAINPQPRIERLVAIDIIPAFAIWDQLHRIAQPLALNWAFLAQPAPIPELMIARDPAEWVEGQLKRLSADRTLGVFDERAVKDYCQQFSDPMRRRAMCEQYRACAGHDSRMELAALESGKRIACPVMVLSGSNGFAKQLGSPLDYWRPWCSTIQGVCIESGHWVAEEAPQELVGCLMQFFSTY